MKNGSNVKALVQNFLAGLSSRQKKILEGRFGLNGKYLTLAEIGLGYGLTRERVRQIEKAALSSIQGSFKQGEPANFAQTISDYLKRHNGVRNEALLMRDIDCGDDHSPYARFFLEACGSFKHHLQDNDFNSYWYLDKESNEQAVSFINKLKNYLKNSRGVPYKPKDEMEVNYISISRSFAHSPYSDFGLAEWSEICPQNSRDWAYLILKKEKQPLHFTELANLIDKVKKSNKKTNAQTVHNELIKDDRFVLVGRGTYGLKEFGLLPGTAREVITHFLKKHGPLKSRDLIKLVLAERTFQENTLLLNLQNRKHFQRLDDGSYTVREA